MALQGGEDTHIPTSPGWWFRLTGCVRIASGVIFMPTEAPLSSQQSEKNRGPAEDRKSLTHFPVRG